MKKLQSLLWGILPSLIGGVLGIIALILLYFLYLKKKGINLGYYVLGYFVILIVMIALLGTAIVTGFWWASLT
jgi:hypothetical protein